MAVILFDIDGTLIRTVGAGKAAMQSALRRTFALTDLSDRVPFSGRTDPAIMRDLLDEHGVAVTPRNLELLAEAYLGNLPVALSEHGGEVCAGVRELLDALERDHRHAIGLLTGNMKRGAERKLGHFDLWKRFPRGGGFGDVHLERDDVARDAVATLTESLGRALNPAEVWVVGDTPLDVKCARAVGAKAVAVATGWHAIDELREAGADQTVADLLDLKQFLLWVG